MVLLALLLVLLLAAGGFALRLLWVLAAIAFVVWLIGFLWRPAGGRWYYW